MELLCHMVFKAIKRNNTEIISWKNQNWLNISREYCVHVGLALEERNKAVSYEVTEQLPSETKMYGMKLGLLVNHH